MSASHPPNQRWFSLPAELESAISRELETLELTFSRAHVLADAVQRLSDHYLEQPLARTPWTQRWAQAAYLAYYLPLNFARARAVAAEATRLGFFEGLEHLFDFGSGSGAALFAFLDAFRPRSAPVAIDVDRAALALAARLKPENLPHAETHDELPKLPAKSLLLASYALTESDELPAAWLECEALALIEPSTSEDGRKLMRHRARLIESGFHIWAPCTHHEACPMLTHSARDWCHDRIHWQAPAWLTEIEKHLPMKNRTLSFSYLLARKTKPAPHVRALGVPAPSAGDQLARLNGDLLIEKGKTRMSVCRNSEREFLAWFPQRLKAPVAEGFDFQRGNLARLKVGLEKRASEVRLAQPDDIREILPTEKPS